MKLPQMFMVDIECVGTDPSDASAPILQVAMLELTKAPGIPFWNPGRLFNKYLGTPMRPPNKWAEDNQSALYAKCNLLLPSSPEAVRAEILEFFNECKAERFPILCGKNIALLDVPFLVNKRYLEAPRTDTTTNRPVGDFSYRLDDISSRLGLAMDLLGTSDRKDLVEQAIAAYPEIKLPTDVGAHDGVYDCYAQTRELNGLIRLCLAARA